MPAVFRDIKIRFFVLPTFIFLCLAVAIAKVDHLRFLPSSLKREFSDIQWDSEECSLEGLVLAFLALEWSSTTIRNIFCPYLASLECRGTTVYLLLWNVASFIHIRSL